MSLKWHKSSLKNFSISDLERFSRVKAHTLRMWERRYAMLQPLRSAGNVRMYPLAELEKLLQVAVLNRHGYRISEIYKMKGTAIQTALQALEADSAHLEKALAELTVCMYACQPEKITQHLNRLRKAWPLEILVESIIYPFLYNTSLLWIGNKLYEEHITVTAVRQKLQYAIEGLQVPEDSASSILLFLTDTKQLDLGLLYSHYHFKRRGFKVLYLGNDITLLNLKSALQFHSFNYIFTYLRNNGHSYVDELLSVISHYSPASTLVIGEYELLSANPVHTNKMLRLPFTEALHAVENRVKR